MSTQAPFTQAPVACSTNWYTRLACKLQALVEPLCEKRSDFALNLYEQNTVQMDLRASNQLVGYASAAGFTSQQWLDIIESSHLVCSEGTMNILAPRLTLWNKLGLGAWKVFSVGTTCSCCWGWRVLLSATAILGFGFLLGKIL